MKLKQCVVTIVFLLTCLFVVGENQTAAAQTMEHQGVSQSGGGGLSWLKGHAEHWQTATSCNAHGWGTSCKSVVESWIQGVTIDGCSYSGAYSTVRLSNSCKAIGYTASNVVAISQDNGTHYNDWVNWGKYWVISTNGTYYYLFSLAKSINYGPNPNTGPGGKCTDVDPETGVCTNTPIIVPLGNTPLKLSAPEVPFDLDGDGTLELISYPIESDKFGFLAIDRNGNGMIDDGTELFGDRTVPGAGEGFSALRQMYVATYGEPELGKIESTHPFFEQLVLWVDANRDGMTQQGELRPASSVLSAIGLGYTDTGRSDPNGNQFRFKGWARYVDGKEKPIYDVILQTAAQ